MLVGDFNMVRGTQDKNSDHFDLAEANRFNELIQRLALIELPLVDRAYTWSNKRAVPTLVRLDRCFISVSWDALFPNTTMATLTRYTSDHVPLLVSVSTTIPRTHCFRFENSWLLNPSFKNMMEQCIKDHLAALPLCSLTKRLKTCRARCRSWSKRRLDLAQREIDVKLLVCALDLLEETRPLHNGEATLRRLAIQGLQDINSEKLAYWRQRFSVRVAVEWDENSKFFHAAASGRRRRNLIANLEHDGQTYTAHSAKCDILSSFYTDLLGSHSMTDWNFSLSDLYPAPSVHGEALSAPFTRQEVADALFSMDKNASPGPDGFGPSFYINFWQSLDQEVLRFFSAFHSEDLDIDGMNRAHLVLLPKKGVLSPQNFRPISLQNCPMKLLTKVMTNRVKPVITELIDMNQTGFIHGKCISENFVFAADILNCCHKRRVPTAVLKLDFKKAFDSVDWRSLDLILCARGFDAHWRRWVSTILHTGKTSVLLNGVPGRWINCKRGLRQGDPISPYLFIIVADVLQSLIKKAHVVDSLSHPLNSALPCPVLQYADDTLIFTERTAAAMVRLKRILDDFALATGLEINFHKSTFVPMNVDDSTAAAMAAILGCP